MSDKLLNTQDFGDYEVRTTLCDGKNYGCEDFEIEQAFTKDGFYISNPKFAKKLASLGIKPELAKPGDNVCTIGFKADTQSWFGWSHRAMFGFRIGSEVKKGDCAYHAANKEDFLEDCLRFWHDTQYHASAYAEFGENEQTNPQTGKPEIVQGVFVRFTYNNKVPNEKLRDQVSSVFTPFPDTFGRGEWTAENLEDARQMACDFAEGVG